jgi:magnesium and cobalt transporter
MGLFNKRDSKKENLILSEELGDEEKEMIEGIMALDETSAKEAMIPRIDTIFINESKSFNEVLKLALETGHSRYPTYKNAIDNVTGILYVKDLLKYINNAEEFSVAGIARRPFFVPESKKLDSLLREFKKKHVHIAVVVDEYGGVSGILSLEDIIERIVGDIQDEFDNEQEEIVRLGSNEYLCDGRVNIDIINEDLHLNLPNQDFDTLGGFVFDLLGKVPNLYESVNYKGTRFIIQQLDGHKIRSVKIIVENHEESSEHS